MKTLGKLAVTVAFWLSFFTALSQYSLWREDGYAQHSHINDAGGDVPRPPH